MDNFANYKNLPLEVQAVLDKHSGDDETYATCQELQDELEQIGWTCEWGLDAVPYNLRQIKTKVLFLLEPEDNIVFAYFPEEMYNEDERFRTCYAHVGQHSSCHTEYAENCDRATSEQYADLKKELEFLGYDLIVINSL